MFHVKLFAEAEPAEECIQHVLHTSSAGQTIESGPRMPKLLSQKHRIRDSSGAPERRRRFGEQSGLPAIDGDGSFAGKQVPRQLDDACEQPIQALAGNDRNGERIAGHSLAFGQIGSCMHFDESWMSWCGFRVAKPHQNVRPDYSAGTRRKDAGRHRPCYRYC